MSANHLLKLVPCAFLLQAMVSPPLAHASDGLKIVERGDLQFVIDPEVTVLPYGQQVQCDLSLPGHLFLDNGEMVVLPTLCSLEKGRVDAPVKIRNWHYSRDLLGTKAVSVETASILVRNKTTGLVEAGVVLLLTRWENGSSTFSCGGSDQFQDPGRSGQACGGFDEVRVHENFFSVKFGLHELELDFVRLPLQDDLPGQTVDSLYDLIRNAPEDRAARLLAVDLAGKGNELPIDQQGPINEFIFDWVANHPGHHNTLILALGNFGSELNIPLGKEWAASSDPKIMEDASAILRRIYLPEVRNIQLDLLERSYPFAVDTDTIDADEKYYQVVVRALRALDSRLKIEELERIKTIALATPGRNRDMADFLERRGRQ